MTFLDGLSSLPQLSAYSQAAIEKLSAEAYSRLHEIAPLNTETESGPCYDPARFVQLGTFAIPKGPKASGQNLFSLQAPTTRDNVSRVVRGCQLPKPILLEGSPGVGKTSLVTALANICGFELCRINLSDQTDLVDLFGSDLPVEGDTPGQFAWKDAEFLRAMQEGHWVLLDEMNLAPQAILEGLNAVLDHRGSVFIPELGKTFSRHPSFRIFAAQNPIHQGGGRKGLPKSFMNRFTKVYVQELSKEDIFMICCNLFPEIEKQIWKAMIEYTTRLHEEVMTKRSFGRVGTPWEFNLRDLIRWGTLIRQSDSSAHPGQFLNAIFLQRFRVDPDRQHALRLFKGVFQDAPSSDIPRQTITPSFIQFGCYSATRDGFSIGKRPGRIFPGDIPSVESVGLCVANNWLTILTGPAGSGKTTLVRTLAHLNGRPLHELAISIATDASDILGSFEEVNALSRTVHIWDVVTALTSQLLASSDGSIICYQIPGLFRGIDTQNVEVSTSTLLRRVSEFVTEIRVKAALSPDQKMLLTQLEGLLDLPHHARFEWVDGPLVNALKYGHWLVLDGANLCSPSVLDRLNSLCEADGVLTLNERGPVNGQIEVLIPHPNFRLFMCVDTQFGELSRAMRNRGLEVALLPIRAEDQTNLLDFLRIPPAYSRCNFRIPVLSHRYELSRRGCTRTELGIAEDFSIPVAQLLNEDSGLDSLVTILPTCLSREPQQQIALSYFFTQSAPLAYLSSLKRFIFQLQSIHSEFVQLYPLVHNLSSSRVIILHERMRTILEQKRGIPTELLAAQVIIYNHFCFPPNSHLLQPLDLRMRRVPFSVDNGELASQIGNMSTLLRLFVALQLSNETPVGETTIVLPTPQQPLPSAPQARVMKEVNLVIASVLDTARLLLDSIDIPTDNTEVGGFRPFQICYSLLTNLTIGRPGSNVSSNVPRSIPAEGIRQESC